MGSDQHLGGEGLFRVKVHLSAGIVLGWRGESRNRRSKDSYGEESDGEISCYFLPSYHDYLFCQRHASATRLPPRQPSRLNAMVRCCFFDSLKVLPRLAARAMSSRSGVAAKNQAADNDGYRSQCHEQSDHQSSQQILFPEAYGSAHKTSNDYSPCNERDHLFIHRTGELSARHLRRRVSRRA